MFLVTQAQTLGVRAAAFDSQGRVFLVRHTYVPGWHLPGGGVDIGETCYAAMEREIREEGNLLLDEPAELFGIYHNRKSALRDHVTLYVCRNVVQTERHAGDKEIADSGFFDIGALPAETTPATRSRLDEIAGTLPQSLTW